MPIGYSGTVGQEQPDMIGQRFGRLLVLNYNAETSKQEKRDCYQVRCNCSKERVVRGNNLRSKRTKSCGCLNREMSSKRLSQMDHAGENSSCYYHGFSIEKNKFRKIIRARDVVCQRCGKTVKENGQELDAHHLDGNDYNHDPKNGAGLCRSCHSTVTRGNNVWKPL